jgi:cytoskeletal protein RodZ
VGTRIKQKRLEAGLTLQAVSHRTQLSTSTLSRLEHGLYQLTVPQFLVLATALHCSATDFLTIWIEGG